MNQVNIVRENTSLPSLTLETLTVTNHGAIWRVLLACPQTRMIRWRHLVIINKPIILPAMGVMQSTHLPIFSTHLPTSRRKLSRPTAVGRCVRKFGPTVGLIPPINADSNVESAVDASLQSDNDVSGVGCDESAYIL